MDDRLATRRNSCLAVQGGPPTEPEGVVGNALTAKSGHPLRGMESDMTLHLALLAARIGPASVAT
jgi:hypothetical protein